MTEALDLPQARGGLEPPEEKPEGSDDPVEDGTEPREREVPGEPGPRDPDMPDAPPGDLIAPGDENPAAPAAD